MSGDDGDEMSMVTIKPEWQLMPGMESDGGDGDVAEDGARSGG